MGEIKFDKMEIDTRLAEEFLKVNKAELDLLIDKTKENIVRPLLEITKFEPADVESTDIDEQLSALAKKIEENAELFAQLEALKRKVSKGDIKKYDIPLLVQNLRYMGNHQWYENSEEFGKESYAKDYIVMSETTPLANLGIAAQYSKECRNFIVQYCDATAPICYLFARLCRAVGFKNNDAKFVYKKQINDYVNRKERCTGVVTEHSDVDSAVDAFLASTSSPVEYKWKLQRIYVQENIYERFKKTLSWKCNLNQSGDQASADVSPHSSDVFIYDQKVFLLDYAGTLEQIKDQRQVILVEAYRTTKELLSMLKKDVSFCISLWSNDLSQSNEIAYTLNANIVWINDYGVFDGPLKVSQALYYLRKPYVNLKDADRVIKVADNWSKISLYDRVEKMKKVFSGSKKWSLNILYEIKEAISCEVNKTVKIDNGKMWVVIDKPNGLVCQTLADERHLIKMLVSVAHGNVCIWNKTQLSPPCAEILTEFEKENLPFICNESLLVSRDKSDNSNTNAVVHLSLYNTRVVYSNYGTIFAN